MISIKRANEAQVDYEGVINHSPVAQEPEASAILKRFIDRATDAYVGYINGEVACIYGLEAPTILSTTKCFLWLLTTDVVDRNKFEFVRNSEIVIENLLKEYELITGTTHTKDERAFKWMKWLGAVYHGHEKTMVPFYITSETFLRRRRWRIQ